MSIKQLLVFVLCTVGVFFWLEKKVFVKKDISPDVLVDSQKKDPGSFYLILAVGLIPSLIGVFGVNYWCKEYNLAAESNSWNKVNAIILEKYVAAKLPVGIGHASPDQQTYSPQIKYTFQVDGKEVVSEGIDLKNKWSSGNFDSIDAQLKQYPSVGASIPIYYDPKTMKTVIVPGNKGTNYFGLIISLVIYALGLWALRFAYAYW